MGKLGDSGRSFLHSGTQAAAAKYRIALLNGLGSVKVGLRADKEAALQLYLQQKGTRHREVHAQTNIWVCMCVWGKVGGGRV